jgi:UDP-glucuronate 4-epimerase
MDFIRVLEEQLGQKATLKMLPMQDGDVYRTWADISELKTNYDYTPTTQITAGVAHFVKWYTRYQENLKNSNN